MADIRAQAQVQLILDHLENAAVYPDNWQDPDNDAEYLFRRGSILIRDRDMQRGQGELRRILEQEDEFGGASQEDERPTVTITPTAVIEGVVRLDYTTTADPSPTVPQILDRLDGILGDGATRPDTVLTASGHPCPATEPEEVPEGTVDPFPPPSADCCCGSPKHHIPQRRCDGKGVFVSIVDTGLLPNAAADHTWLAGVDGDPEDPFDAAGLIRKYAGHGTFVAGCLRCTAPEASVYVDGANLSAGAIYESEVVPRLAQALERSPDVVVFTFAAETRHELSLLGFDALYESRIRPLKGLAFVSPADNDGTRATRWPAAYPWVISVGALSANWRSRADFSNYGGWVDVYAPGEGLVNAFATGDYECDEPPNQGVRRHFEGMAKWSGTSFSTPLVAGLIAARMSVTGENGRQAAKSLLRFARRQTIPGVGAVLFPGQAYCDRRRHRMRETNQ